jgi:hypothetical protein
VLIPTIQDFKITQFHICRLGSASLQNATLAPATMPSTVRIAFREQRKWWAGLMSLMDKFLPSYQFSERHQTAVRCGPGELLDIIQSLQPPKDGFSEVAMFVRQLPAKLMHWVAPSRVPRPSPFNRGQPPSENGRNALSAGIVPTILKTSP